MRLLSKILFLLITLPACREDKQAAQAKTFLELTDTLCLSTRYRIPLSSKAMYFHEEQGKRYLIIENENTREIIFVNIDNQKIENIIQIKEDGPDGMPLNFGYAVKSLDSIFVPTDGFRLYLINRQGHVLKKIYFDTLDNGQNLPIRSFSRFSSPMLFKGDFIYGVQLDGIPHYQSEIPDNYKFCYQFNLAANTVCQMPACHPVDFWKDQKKEVFFSWDFDGQRFIISPVFSHNLYLSKDLRQIDSVYAVQSSWVHKFRDGTPQRLLSLNFYQFAREALSTQSYLGIKYDPYREVYYRFFFPGVGRANEMTDDEVLSAHQDPPNFGIMVLDKNFRVICELVLPENIYLQHHFFIAKEGLFLAANHPKNPDVKESELCFHIYTLRN